MAASHFFVGLSAGVALLSVPVLLFSPARDMPGQFAAWVAGPSASRAAQTSQVDVVNRPTRGFVAGQPTPSEDGPPPTLAALARPTATPRPGQSAGQSAPQGQTEAIAPAQGGSGLRTGVIRGAGASVTVRRAAGVDSPDDPRLGDGSPVLVSSGAELSVNGQAWRAVRGLNGVAGWVPSTQVAVDGEAPVTALEPTPGLQAERLRIANTDGIGVALRNSPRDRDRAGRGLTDNTQVVVLEWAGADWARVRADNGSEGWVPTRYLAPPG